MDGRPNRRNKAAFSNYSYIVRPNAEANQKMLGIYRTQIRPKLRRYLPGNGVLSGDRGLWRARRVYFC